MEPITTKLWVVDKKNPDPYIIGQAADIIRRGGLVAFPTETVYGLGANGLNGAAVAGIYRAKGRPSDNPLILHVADKRMAEGICPQLSETAKKLMALFWPGPLTLVVPKKAGIPEEVTGGLNTVAIRMPDHPVALALIRAAGVPVAAPSANRSGRPSPTTAAHVQQDLQGRIDAILDAGPAGLGLESTVLDLTVETPVILRPGGITFEQLTEALGKVLMDPSVLGEKLPENQSPRSPGMKYAHYAPAAKVVLFEGEPKSVVQCLGVRTGELLAGGERVGILATEENQGRYPKGSIVLTMGPRENPSEAAAVLFSLLRQFDEHQVDVILAEGLELGGIGLAVMNRLRRAAAEVVKCE
ncbi:L-threonylcarbamoyladenylate synthase [Desulforamulus ruminis]|uniref:Threonylcarbamoyl-AMP synthase n=1 Tax=Desulforamulus ruminis (strain ATCC 23193 / DSM 2154 / NCIMB 8452 / DL) TaxID=696281 RepID=F6DP75_DESRL|nr:L-threonylcarbamoyladenylate synthase [Desulforamulus ruminis]AEG61904.1 Sua5/YciO/YrdC/YwlC family protein [Desulforamulus ruminis DSM 2154]